MRNYFCFGDYDSRDFGVYISGRETFGSPARDYDDKVVPGRHGSLLGMDSRLENIKITYPAFMYTNYEEGMAALKSALLSTVGYARLTDTYHPDIYRMAVYRGPLTPKTSDWNQSGEFDIEFECKPQQYLIEGEKPVEFTAAGSILNPTAFDSQPLIRIYGYGTVGIGSETITIAQHNNAYIDVDCEMMENYCGTTNCNSLVSFSGNDFPVIPPGPCGVTKTSNISKIEITPRWWRV